MTSTEALRPVVRWPSAAFGLVLMTIAGCGGSPADGFSRFPVEGTVTLDGKPLVTGTISFNALQQGASASGPIAEGAFRLVDDDGLSPGPYRVEIYSLQPTGKKVPHADDLGTLVDETVNIVPKSYNINSVLKAEIPAGGPKEPLSFPLVGSPAKPPKR
ncbi:hypothetical protein [Singulisphaera acidiphila]|uniref:Carboxypeptidase regulatory-like domain-containing protein n=1 Tax=Singulisphaera acidiphila (strain ATCC BAA-1392 / DSM 18658 / VKM B-2454 / MOB10) TaxID=886293 RepID=L0DQ84_SINAD|nr:hypothetical protein [Singulisphaera acidiphila]AGA31028.1 hypothetical protein Sinac_6972 [Singulisphaera acidiphila DSM 18658]